MNREQLTQYVREWVKCDNEMRALNRELAQRKEDKKRISQELIVYMRENHLDEFDIKDGQLVYVKKSKKKPISQKHLLNLLTSYYNNSEQADALNTYLLENREESVSERIIRRGATSPPSAV